MMTERAASSLRLRLLAALTAPLVLSGCWETIDEQGTLTLLVSGGQPCPRKEDVPTGGSDDPSGNCHRRVIVSIDEGPVAQDVAGASGEPATLCQYLVTREQTFTPGNSFCIGGGRPLIVGALRVARVVRGPWESARSV
jgi:hypothetical protein